VQCDESPAAVRFRGQDLFVGSVRATTLFSLVAAVSVLSERARAAGAAYAVDTAEVSEPGELDHACDHGSLSVGQ